MKLFLAVAAGLLLAYILLLAALLVAKPRGNVLVETLRLLPDVVRLVRRLAADALVPRGVRIRLWLLLGYLALPFDLVPDVIPVLGYADDAIILTLVLRSVVRRAGFEAVRRNWPGTEDGLAALTKVTGLRSTVAADGPERLSDAPRGRGSGSAPDVGAAARRQPGSRPTERNPR